MPTIYLSLGSNLGDREKNLCAAITRLSRLGRVTGVSSFYETEPVEFIEQPWFLNCAMVLSTDGNPQELLQQIFAIEQEMGRDRALEKRKGPRVIDIDILLFDDLVLNSAALTIPHPAMHQRRFVLAPLAEIAPHVRHPVFNKTTQDLLAELPMGQAVRRIPTRANAQAPTASDRPKAG